MARKKKQEPEKVVLTEWQKRNIEFLKKREEEKVEKEKLDAKLRDERKEQLQKEKEESDLDDSPVEKTIGLKESLATKVALKKTQKIKEKSERSPFQKSKSRAIPVLVVSGLILLVSLFLITPYSKKKEVTVTGISHVMKADILSASGIKDSDYIFSLIFNHSSYEKNVVANNKWIKKAKLSYQFPNHFTLKVTEYNVVAYTQTANGYQPILENGSRTNIVSGSGLPETFLMINLTSEKDIQTLIQDFSKLDTDLVTQIKTISSANSSTTADLLNLEMHDGNIVRVPLSELVEKLPYYTKIKSNLSETSIIDMEVGIYTTTAAIETQAAADKEAKSAESSTEAVEGTTATETEGTSDTISNTSTETTESTSVE